MSPPGRRPVRHVLGISGPCNNHCRECGARLGDPVRPSLPPVERGDLIEMTGAEPTMVPGIFDLARKASAAGCTVRIGSNGRAFAYPETARKAASAGVAAVSISLHGTSAAVHDSFTRVPGSFDQSVSGARNLRRAGVRVEIRARAAKTAAAAGRMIGFAAGIGARQITFVVADPVRSVFDRSAELAAATAAARRAPAGFEVFLSYSGMSVALNVPAGEVECTIDPARGDVSAAPRNWCANRCVFCTPKAIFARHGLPLPLDTPDGLAAAIDRIAAETPRRGAFEFTTIEPAENPGIFEMAAMARRAGFRRLDLWTHGRTLSDRATAADLVKAGFGRFRIPIHGPDARTHDLVAGSAGAFDETVAGIENLLSLGVTGISYCATLCAQNQDSLDALGRFARDRLGVECLPFADARPSTSHPADFVGYACRLGRVARAAESSSVFANAAIGFIPPCLFCDPDARAAAVRALPSAKDNHIGWVRKGHEDKERAPCPNAPECRFSDVCPGINPQYGALFGYAEFRPLPIEPCAGGSKPRLTRRSSPRRGRTS